MILFTLPKEALTKISVKDFKSRFSGAEMRAIDQAALTDDDVYRYDKLIESVQIVNLLDPDTINGIKHLVSLGVLTEQRSYEILKAS